ncbi:putative ankyrin repeat protein [Fusarium oxysporum f. sp. albedinis]|nr:putative ankyrin repeat protein [Fusarium oxysporum f. sp. albedinis]
MRCGLSVWVGLLMPTRGPLLLYEVEYEVKSHSNPLPRHQKCTFVGCCPACGCSCGCCDTQPQSSFHRDSRGRIGPDLGTDYWIVPRN